jgi:hypothetical protein
MCICVKLLTLTYYSTNIFTPTCWTCITLALKILSLLLLFVMFIWGMTQHREWTRNIRKILLLSETSFLIRPEFTSLSVCGYLIVSSCVLLIASIYVYHWTKICATLFRIGVAWKWTKSTHGLSKIDH